MKKLLLTLLLLLGACTLVMAAGGPKEAPTAAAAAKTGGTLYLNWPEYENMARREGNIRGGHVGFIEPLMYMTRDGKLNGVLATKWTSSDDGLTHTITLRPGVKWHDGVPFNADDVVFSIKFILGPANVTAHGYTWKLFNEIVGASDFAAGKATDVSGMKKIDDYTVSFTLAKPDGPWLSVVFAPYPNGWGPLPQHIFKDVKWPDIAEEYAPAWNDPKLQIGTGPFKFDSAKLKEFAKVVRNDAYWGQKAILDAIIYKNFGQADTQFIAMKKGELHGMSLPATYVNLALQAGLDVSILQNFYVQVLWINLYRPYLQDVRVRQAFAYLINKQELADTVMRGLASPWHTFVEWDPWANMEAPQYNYDPKKAKELLDAAAADGKWDWNQEIELHYYYPGTEARDWMAAVATYFTAAGVKARPAFYEGTASDAKTSAHDFDLVRLGLGWGVSDPSAYAGWIADPVGGLYQGQLPDHIANMRKLFDEGVATGDRAKRKAIYDQIQQIWTQDLVAIPMLRMKGVNAYSKQYKAIGMPGPGPQTPTGDVARPNLWYLEPAAK